MRKDLMALLCILLIGALRTPLAFTKQQKSGAAQSADKSPQLSGEMQETTIRSSGETTMRRTLEKETIEVSLNATQLKNSDSGFPTDLDTYNEVSLLQYIRVLVDGHSVAVPRSAFKDLFNVRTAWLASEKGLFVLGLGGGDGGDLYVARIYFDSRIVHRRALFAASNQKLPLEQTFYRTKVTAIGRW